VPPAERRDAFGDDHSNRRHVAMLRFLSKRLAPLRRGFSSGGRRMGLVGQGLIPRTDRQHAEQISGFILRKRSPNEICRNLRMKTGLNGNALIEQ
jgi:hypothetical protein